MSEFDEIFFDPDEPVKQDYSIDERISKQEIINRLMANLKDGEPEDMIYVAESKILDIYQNMSVEQLLDILNKVEQARDIPENSYAADAEDEDFPEMGDDEDFDETYPDGFHAFKGV